MASIRKFWRCNCKDEKGKARGYKKVHTGEKAVNCKHCGQPMILKDKHVARISVNGTTRTVTAKNRQYAKDFITTCETARMKGDLLPGEEEQITFEDAKKEMERWMDAQVKTGDLSAASRAYYKSGLKPLEEEFEDYTLQGIEKPEVEEFLRDRRAEVGPAMVNCSLSALKRLYSLTCDSRPARKFPRLHEQMTDIFKIKASKLPKGRDIILETEEEIQMLLDQCTAPHLYMAVYIALNTGLRIHGCLSLKSTEILFRQNVIRKVVKGGKEVTIPMTNQLHAKLKEWIDNQKVRSINHYIIPSRYDSSKCYRTDADIGLESACERAAKVAEKAKKKDLAKRFRSITFHNLRHTFATHYLYKTSKQYGATVAVHNLSKILAHSTTYITERYSHVLQEINAEAMEVFGNEMFGQSV